MSGELETYTIGRDPSCEIHLAAPTVSRRHAELVVRRGSVYYLTDCASTGGTCRSGERGWERVRQAYIKPDEPLMFGDYQTSAAQLLAIAKRLEPAPDEPETAVLKPPSSDEGRAPVDDRPVGRVRRNPETGELESF